MISIWVVNVFLPSSYEKRQFWFWPFISTELDSASLQIFQMFFCSPINPPRKSCPEIRLGSMFMKYHQVTLPGKSTLQERSGRARGAHSDFPQWDAGGEQAAGFAQPVRIHLAWILGLGRHPRHGRRLRNYTGHHGTIFHYSSTSTGSNWSISIILPWLVTASQLGCARTEQWWGGYYARRISGHNGKRIHIRTIIGIYGFAASKIGWIEQQRWAFNQQQRVALF